MFNFVQVQASGPLGLRPGGAGDPAMAGLTADIHEVFRVPLKRDEPNVPPLGGRQKETFFKGLFGLVAAR